MGGSALYKKNRAATVNTELNEELNKLMRIQPITPEDTRGGALAGLGTKVLSLTDAMVAVSNFYLPIS
jgi:hypothetical protein